MFPLTGTRRPQTVIGVIPIDSIYSPVTKVNYTVEPTRVGDKTDFDKLTLEVWTDSTISAKDAVSLGAKILSDHLTVLPTCPIPSALPPRSWRRPLTAPTPSCP